MVCLHGSPRRWMKLGFVVPRYGMSVVGGAETLCRQYAERLSARGHHVEVFSTCARDHFTWKNEESQSEEYLHGIEVHRYPVSYLKDTDLVASLEQRIAAGERLGTTDQ